MVDTPGLVDGRACRPLGEPNGRHATAATVADESPSVDTPVMAGRLPAG
jgi:hypothetical protein